MEFRLNANQSKFLQTYAEKLTHRINTDPDYGYLKSATTIIGNAGNTVLPIKTPEEIALKMTLGLINGTANHNGKAIKDTCKALGIKHTKRDIKLFLDS